MRNDPNSFVARFFQQCFPTSDDWAVALTSKTSNCTKLANEVISEKFTDPRAAHMTANFQHYTAQTIRGFPGKEVLVVRIEHMWDDLQTLDQQLGGTGNFGERFGTKVSHGSERFQASSLSTISTQALCCALQREIEIYRDLLFAAANLNENDKQSTWEAAVKRCGWNSWEVFQESCNNY